MKTKILILALVLFLAAAGAAVANGGVELPRWVLSSGASDSAGGGGITLRATLGQPVVGVVASGSGDITLAQGFWCGATPGYDIYLPLVMRG
jgi:hypothetical protein